MLAKTVRMVSLHGGMQGNKNRFPVSLLGKRCNSSVNMTALRQIHEMYYIFVCLFRSHKFVLHMGVWEWSERKLDGGDKDVRRLRSHNSGHTCIDKFHWYILHPVSWCPSVDWGHTEGKSSME